MPRKKAHGEHGKNLFNFVAIFISQNLAEKQEAGNFYHGNSFAANSTNAHENWWNAWPSLFRVLSAKFRDKKSLLL